MEQNINDKKNEIKIRKKENFKEKYSKIDLMRQKHKEYIKFDNKVKTISKSLFYLSRKANLSYILTKNCIKLLIFLKLFTEISKNCIP